MVTCATPNSAERQDTDRMTFGDRMLVLHGGARRRGDRLRRFSDQLIALVEHAAEVDERVEQHGTLRSNVHFDRLHDPGRSFTARDNGQHHGVRS
jgi:hypothetical protein